MRQKLTIFPYGQYIIGIDGSLAFQIYRQVRGRCWGLQEIYKNATVILCTTTEAAYQAAAFHANVVMATIASFPGVRLFCAVWAIFASPREHSTCCYLCIVRSSLIALMGTAEKWGHFPVLCAGVRAPIQLSSGTPGNLTPKWTAISTKLQNSSLRNSTLSHQSGKSAHLSDL